MLRFGLSLAGLTILLDQLSKHWILDLFAGRGPGERVELAPFFNLALTWNRGMSFGLFNGQSALNTVVFTVLAAVIVVALVVWLRRADNAIAAAGIGLVIGGAIGNVIDRLRLGAVVDFLDFHLAGWHFYVFNLADSAISVGVGLMLLDSVLGRRAAPN